MEVIKHFSGLPVRFEVNNSGIITHAADLGYALGLSNPAESIVKHVWAEYRFKHRSGVGSPAWYLTEAGVWQLIFKSDHQKAIKIQRWVFEEVLPAIRKDGGYISPDATKEQLEALQKQVDIYSRAFWNMAHAQTTNHTIEKEIDKVRFLLPGASEHKEMTEHKETADELDPTLEELFTPATSATIQRKLYNSTVLKSDFIKTAQHLGFITPKNGLISLKASQIDFLIKETKKKKTINK